MDGHTFTGNNLKLPEQESKSWFYLSNTPDRSVAGSGSSVQVRGMKKTRLFAARMKQSGGVSSSAPSRTSGRRTEKPPEPDT